MFIKLASLFQKQLNMLSTVFWKFCGEVMNISPVVDGSLRNDELMTSMSRATTSVKIYPPKTTSI